MKYLIFCDMDGSILNDNEDVSSYSISLIKEISKNHIFCLVTSNSLNKVLPIYNKLGLDTFIACRNGGLIINPNYDKSFSFVIDKKDFLIFFNDLKSIITSCFYKCNNNVFCYNFDERYKIIMPFSSNNIVNSGDFNDLNLLDSTNIFFIINPMNCILFENYFSNKNLRIECLGKDAKRAIYIISHFKASKLNATSFLKNIYSFDKSIGFGDSIVDVDFLNECDFPFIMKNTSLKTNFKVTKYTNNEDGVAKELEEFILNNI